MKAVLNKTLSLFLPEFKRRIDGQAFGIVSKIAKDDFKFNWEMGKEGHKGESPVYWGGLLEPRAFGPTARILC